MELGTLHVVLCYRDRPIQTARFHGVQLPLPEYRGMGLWLPPYVKRTLIQLSDVVHFDWGWCEYLPR